MAVTWQIADFICCIFWLPLVAIYSIRVLSSLLFDHHVSPFILSLPSVVGEDDMAAGREEETNVSKNRE